MSGSGRLARATVLALSVDDTADVLECEADRVLVHLDLVGLALDAVVEVRLRIAPVAARGSRPKRLAGVLMAVAPDMPGEPTPASRTGQEPGQPVLAAVDPAAVPPAVLTRHSPMVDRVY